MIRVKDRVFWLGFDGGRRWWGGFKQIGGFLREARERIFGDLEGALGHEGVDGGG